MQRKAYLSVHEGELSDKRVDSGIKPLWVAGVFVYIIAAVPDVLAYAMIPQLVCSTVACFRLVIVALMAHVFLGERVRCREMVGIVLCCCGTCLCLWFGPPRDSGKNVSSNLFYHPQVFLYIAGGGTLLCVLLLVDHLDCFQCETIEHCRSFFLPLATALAFALEKVFNTELGFMHLPKSVRDPGWLFMSTAVAACGVLDFYLNLRGAQRLPIQVFVPLVFAFTTGLLYIQSVMVFNEFEHATVPCKVFSFSGALLSLCGALVIQPLGADQASRNHSKVMLEDAEEDGDDVSEF